MNFWELIKTALRSLENNKGRTVLTMLGLVIGIASVISLLAIGNGAQKTIEKSVTSLGSNLLTIQSSAQQTGIVVGSSGSDQNLTMEDVKAIKTDSTLVGVKDVSPEISQNLQAVSNISNSNVSVTGAQPIYASIHNYELSAGSFISEQDLYSERKVAVIGPDTAQNLFGTKDIIGESIRLNKIQFKIIGVTVAKGSNGFQSSDDFVIVPLSTSQKVLFGQNKLRTVVVQAQNSNQMTDLQAQLDTLLRTRHKIDQGKESDFSIRNSASLLTILNSITTVLTALLASVAGISLLVSGIGIMNIMIVTVTERTKEIGLRKAVGAKNSSILSQFLIESVILTFSGGVIGVLISYLIAFVISYLKILDTEVTLFSVALSAGISIAIGLIFGLYPAYKAAKLSPIEALKYE